MECFQWNSNYNIEEVKSELADVINYALLLADKLGANPKKIVLDKIMFGRWHYNKKKSEYKELKKFYNRCVDYVENFCQEKNFKYI